MRTTLNIEDKLIQKASQLTGIKEKTHLVRLGLKALISLESSKRLAKLGGTEKELKMIPEEDLRVRNMILVDTSVWISHLRDDNSCLKELLNNSDVLCHIFIIGELACGNIKNRNEILSLLKSLPMAQVAEYDEVLKFIEDRKLARKGLGYVDVHLLASAILSDFPIWSLDKKLSRIALELNIDFKSE